MIRRARPGSNRAPPGSAVKASYYHCPTTFSAVDDAPGCNLRTGPKPHVILLFVVVMNSCIYSGFQWLTRSGIQRSSGGASRFYHTEANKHASVSTGRQQLLRQRLAAKLRSRPGRRAGVRPRPRAASCWTKPWTRKSRLFRHEVVEEGDLQPWSYLLDSVAGLRALIDLWKVTQEPAYAEQAERCGICH